MPEDSPRILILGVGNVLMKDEGIGNRVAEELEHNYRFPADVRLMDAGTMGLGMMHLFRGVEFLLIVDAIDGTGYPSGTVVRVAPEDFAPNQVLHSLHDVRVVDVLAAASLIGASPQAECIGIQVEDMAPAELTMGLSESVESALPRAIAAILYVLEEHDIHAQPLDSADPEFVRRVTAATEDISRSQSGRA